MFEINTGLGILSGFGIKIILTSNELSSVPSSSVLASVLCLWRSLSVSPPLRRFPRCRGWVWGLRCCPAWS